jgi:ComF family protein
LCGTVLESAEDLCKACALDIKRVEDDFCKACGLGRSFCCCGASEALHKILIAPFYYEGAIKKAIGRFKFEGHKKAGELIAKEVSQRIKQLSVTNIDCVVPVPITQKQQRKRGYNQSSVIAGEISRQLGFHYLPNGLVKVRDITPQHSLKYAERQKNVVGVFDVSDKELIKGKNILLCDDIKTSGATLAECTNVLKTNGALSVVCVAAAVVRLHERW